MCDHELTGAERIAKERQRQIDEEGWTPEHDDQHDDHELISAAFCYMLAAESPEDHRDGKPPITWPWDAIWWKFDPDDPLRALDKAGALLAAAIDKQLRKEQREAAEVPSG